MVEVSITLKALLWLPEGSSKADRGRGFYLPNGDWLKPFVVLERNDETDTTAEDLEILGVYLEDCDFEYELDGEA